MNCRDGPENGWKTKDSSRIKALSSYATNTKNKVMFSLLEQFIDKYKNKKLSVL